MQLFDKQWNSNWGYDRSIRSEHLYLRHIRLVQFRILPDERFNNDSGFGEYVFLLF